MQGKDVRWLPDDAIVQIIDFNDRAACIKDERLRNAAKIKHELAVRTQVGAL